MPILLPTPAESLGAGSTEGIVKGTGLQVPSGIAGLIQYNGLTMNKRNWRDTIVITKIDGLGDPDLRDDREVNPQEDGETAFDSFYGGRTLVLYGYVRAFTYDKMLDLWTALTTAFLPLEEMPLIMQGKNFATSSQIYCKKFAPITKTDEQTRDDLFVREFMITVRASRPAFLSLDQQLKFLALGEIDSFNIDTKANYLNTAGSPISQVKVENGVLQPTNSSSTREFLDKTQITDYVYPRISIDYKGETTFAESIIGAILKRLDSENWLRPRINGGGVMDVSKIEGGSLTSLGSMVMVKGSSTVTRSLGTTYRAVFKIEDGKVWIEHGPANGEPDSIGYVVIPGPQMIKFVNGVRAKSYVQQSNPNTTYVYDNIIFSAAQSEGEVPLLVINNGNYKSPPIIQIAGPITSPRIKNLTSGKDLIFKSGAVIPAGEIWTWDASKKTLVDSNGNNKFNNLDPTSDRPFVVAGENDYRLIGTNTGTQINGTNQRRPSLTILSRHSWF